MHPQILDSCDSVGTRMCICKYVHIYITYMHAYIHAYMCTNNHIYVKACLMRIRRRIEVNRFHI